MCGPSGAEKSLQKASESFAGMLRDNYGKLFANQDSVLAKIKGALSPIVGAGPSQTGMSGAEVSQRQADIIARSGAATKNALQAARTFGAGQGGGGTSGVTSGITKQINSAIASQGAQAEGSALNNLEAQNYELGRDNFWKAEGGMQQLGKQYDPNAAQEGATNQNMAAFKQASQITTENNALGQDIAGFATALAGSAGDIASAARGGGGARG